MRQKETNENRKYDFVTSQKIKPEAKNQKMTLL